MGESNTIKVQLSEETYKRFNQFCAEKRIEPATLLVASIESLIDDWMLPSDSNDEKLNQHLLDALTEAEYMETHLSEYKKYTSVDDMFMDILNEKEREDDETLKQR